MPRIIIDSTASPRPAEILIDQLTSELQTPGAGPLPLIIERHLAVTNSRHVSVIWDRWGELSEEDRIAVILQAYENAEGLGTADNITVAMGVRPQEAKVFGLLPYAVRPLHEHFAERTDYRQALAQESPRTVLGVNARELRYPDEAAANRALERLQQMRPPMSWVVHHEIDEED